ncbi:MAG: EamA family transporter RarD, partial [Gammaproteobacteria bacterium]
YGLLHKKFGIGAVQGLFSQTLLLLLLAAGYLCFSLATGGAVFTALDRTTAALLIAGGIVTAAPLLLFLAATHRLTLSTIGLMQYLAPSLNFVLAVFVYEEAFTRAHTITFVLIWTGLAIYTSHLLATQKGRPAAPDAAPIET